MCQIQFVYNKEGLQKKDLDELIKLMCFGSLSNNKDVWGIFNKNKMIKKSGEFSPDLIDDSFLNGNFIVGHNRFSTLGVGQTINWRGHWKNKKLSGREEEKIKEIQHHPFELTDFMLVHNGIITNALSIFKKYKLKTQIKTDSYSIIFLIDYYFKMSQKETRKLRVIDAIQKTSKKLDGWYSVILYDKKDDAIYYFRNDNTTFHFNLIDKKLLVGSLNKINLNYIYINQKKEHFIPKKDLIYLINKTDNELYTEVGRLSKSRKEGDEIKGIVMKEKKGEIYKLINSLPGKPTKYDISESLKLKINCKKGKEKLLQKYLKQKNINYKLNKNKLMLKLEDIYHGN